MRWLDCLRTCRTHFCRRPSPRQAAWIAVAVVAVGAVIILTALGLLQKGADHVRSLFGLWGYVVYGALIMYTGLPFGYGWCALRYRNPLPHTQQKGQSMRARVRSPPLVEAPYVRLPPTPTPTPTRAGPSSSSPQVTRLAGGR